jgi:uncharacterized protein YjbJ (UPF0337 family)
LRRSVSPCKTCTYFCYRSREQQHFPSLGRWGLDASNGRKLDPDSKAISPYFHAQKNAAFAATRRKTVNKDQVSGKVEQAVGKVKQSVGETLGNEKLANQGVADQAKGATKEAWGNAKDAVREVQQSHKDDATDKAHETRNKITQSVQDAKEKVNEKIDKFKERHSA